jgi:CHAD domain-containing protein
MRALPRAAGSKLAAAGIEAAASWERAKNADRVHDARVASKRLRTFWRVLGPSIGAAAARRRRSELSRAARFLAVARERDVLADLARGLARSEKDLADPLAAFLTRLPPAPSPRALERKLRAVAERLESSSRALERAARRARPKGLREGLQSLKRKLEKARAQARVGGDMTDLHACRKRAKDLKYILEALDMSRSSARRFGKAADELGDARDLRMLAARARLRDVRLETKARRLEAAALARL